MNKLYNVDRMENNMQGNQVHIFQEG
jgi:hypothetical protein